MRVTRRPVLAPTLIVLAAAAIVPVVGLAGAAQAGTAGNLADLQAALANCTGDSVAPTEITLTDNISSAGTSLTVPCLVQLELSGYSLDVMAVTVSSGAGLIVDDTSAGGSQGTLSAAQGLGASGIRLSSSRLEIDGGNVVAATVAATTDGRVEVNGGSLTAGDSDVPQGVGLDLGDNGLFAAAGGTVRASGGVGGAGASLGVDGAFLVAGGAVTATGGVGAAGVTMGDRGVVVAVEGSLDATGGSDSAGIAVPATGRVSVSGGTVHAVGGSSGAGIGSGQDAAAGRVEISGGDTTAIGGDDASGIGAGNGGTSGPLLMSGGTLTASAPSTGTALGVDASSGPIKIQAGTLRLPSGTMQVPDALTDLPEFAIGTGAVLEGSDPANGPVTYATYSGDGQLKNSGVIRVPEDIVTGVEVDNDYHRVTFDTQGGTPSTGGPVNLLAPSFSKAGQAFPAAPKKSGLDFDGWNSAPDGSGTAITATSQIPGVASGGGPAAVTAYAIFVVHKPTIAGTLTSPFPKSKAGWYRAGVTVRYACTKGTLPLESRCPSTVVLGREGRGLSIVRSLSDTAGNVATSRFVGIRIDRTAPNVDVTGVRPGAVYDSPRKLGCHVSDVLSGGRGCLVTSGRTGKRVHYTLVGYDRAGNKRVKTGYYQLR